MLHAKTRRYLIGVGSILLAMHVTVLLGLAITFQQYPMLVGLTILAYGFGLRHSVDPDHIAAIDNVTRKLVQDGKRPTAVGFFFALGHSTIVLIVSALLGLFASWFTAHLPMFRSTGSMIGTGVSSLFLIAIGTINLSVLIETITLWKKVKSGINIDSLSIDDSPNRGLLTRILKPMMKLIQSSWQMYFVGLLFGLGFDTASEIALLSMTGTASGTTVPFFAVMILPLAFTAAMSLIDTIDGVLMLGAYGWALMEPMRKLYYNMCITAISVVVALIIGTVEGIQLLAQKSGQTPGFLAFFDNLQIGNWGFYIIGIILFCWTVSVVLNKSKEFRREA